MAEECTDQSCVATASSSSPPPHWWDLHATNSLSSWPNNPWHHPNPNSNSSCDDDASVSPSFTNHSALTVDSSRPPHHQHHNRFIGEQPAASDHHIWSQVFLGAGGNNEELHNSQGVGENLLDALSSKSLSTGMFEPACDYLKQLESWELTNSPSFNGLMSDVSLMDPKRLTKLSNLVSNWSIAPPNPELTRHFDPLLPCNNDSTNSCGLNVNINSDQLYGHDHSDHLKLEEDPWEMDGARRRNPFDVNAMGHQIGNNNISSVGNNNKGYYGIHNPPRNFADVISFSSRLGKPLIDPNKPSFKASNLSDNCKKQALQTSPPTRVNGGRGHGINEGKKKRISEDNLETVPKKTKLENSTVSSTAKLQVPKVKLADKITALQQIVSPFGKTDTASVLYEAIGYIKFLQEQVQLLSNPYMKTNSPKDPWGGMMDRKEKGDARHDLRSRGLCLVPISCTPQVYRENTGSDYWTPAYRGCLYR